MIRLAAVALGLAVALGGFSIDAGADVNVTKRYVVVLAGTEAAGGFVAADRTAVLALVQTSGGVVQNDLSSQVGVLMVESSNVLFAQALRNSPLVAEIGEDWRWQAFPSYQQAVASGQLTVCDGKKCPPGGPEESVDPLEPLQWDMDQIDTPEAHAVQAGSRSVDVGILDSGIDGHHPDFVVDGAGSNVDCARGHNSVSFLPTGPGVGTPDPCIDNQFHGTHVAGTVAAQANGLGIVGVAPNVTLVPVKTCDASGYCYASAVVDAITYAGDAKLDVVNMSFFVDDDEFQRVDRVQVHERPDAAVVQGGGRTRTEVRGQARRRARCRARELRPGSREPEGRERKPDLERVRGRARRVAGCDRDDRAREHEREVVVLELRVRRCRRRRTGRQRAPRATA